MKGFLDKNDTKGVKKKETEIIDQNEVEKLIKKYKKIKKFKKSNIHTINQLYGKTDIIQELVNEYMDYGELL